MCTKPGAVHFAKYGDVFVPHRQEQIGIVCDLVADIPVRRVLDLCCGEGLFAEEYLRRQVDGNVTILDKSDEMLALAEKRLAPFKARYDTVQADIEDRRWRSGFAYGGVVSSLAVHHVSGAGKQALYKDIQMMLVSGGVFVMADLIEPAGRSSRRLAGNHWARVVEESSQKLFGGPEAAEAFERAEWNYFRSPDEHPLDQPSSVTEHLDWLRAAGFAEVDIVWMLAGHAIFTAKKLAGH